MTISIFVLVLIAAVALRLPASFGFVIAAFSALAYSIGLPETFQISALSFLAGADHFLTIMMFAVAGELARVMSAQVGLRRLAQSILAGSRSAPILAPVLAASLQGPLLMRSGLSFARENAQEASQMIDTMEGQGLMRQTAWGGLAAAGGCALMLPPSYLIIIVAVTLDVSIVRLMLGVLAPALILLLLLAAVCMTVARIQTLRPIPQMGISRLALARRDLSGMATQLLAPFLIFFVVMQGIGTPSESAALIVPIAFAIAWLQPLRPRFKDIVVALRRATIASSEFFFLIGTTAFVAKTGAITKTDWSPLISAINPGLSETVSLPLVGFFVPALLASLFGIPLGLLLACLLALSAGTTPDTTFAVLLLLATTFGATLKLLWQAPATLRPASLKERLQQCCIWSVSFVITWLMTWRLPWISKAVPDIIFG